MSRCRADSAAAATDGVIDLTAGGGDGGLALGGDSRGLSSWGVSSGCALQLCSEARTCSVVVVSAVAMLLGLLLSAAAACLFGGRSLR